MPKGTPLTPTQLAIAAQVFAKTGNVSEAARVAGCDESAVRRRLDLSKPNRTELHARACATGLRLGRKHLVACIDLTGTQLATELAAGSMEPKDTAALARALSGLVMALARVDERAVGNRMAALARKKTRAVIAKTRLEIAELEVEAQRHGGGSTRKLVKPGDPGWDDIQREVFGSARQGMTGGRERAPAERDPGR